ERRAFVSGVLIAAPVTAVVLAIVVHAEGGVAPFLAAMRENYSSLGTTGETYSGGSVIALDAGALVERLLGRTPGAALARVAATQVVITSANGAALVAALLVVSVALLAARTGASETAG